MVKGRVQILHSCKSQYAIASYLVGCTYSSVVLLQHLHIRIVRETFLAYGREVCGLPARSVQVLFNLRHSRDNEVARSAGGIFGIVCRCRLATEVSVSAVDEYVIVGRSSGGRLCRDRSLLIVRR